MRNLAQEISEDTLTDEEFYDTVANEAAIDGAFGDDVDILNSDILKANSLDEEITQLTSAAMAIDNFGINKSSFAILRATGLMSGTSLEAIALESVQDESFSSENTKFAVEALTTKIVDKVTEWSSKILSIVANGTKNIMAILSPIWDRIGKSFKSLSTKAWDASKAAGKSIKAHPVRYLIAFIAAAAATAGVVAYFGGGFPKFGATNDILKNFASGMMTKWRGVKLPVGKISPSMILDDRACLVGFDTSSLAAIGENKVSALGYSKNAVISIFNQLSRVWKTIGGALTSMWNRVISPLKMVFKPLHTAYKYQDSVGGAVANTAKEAVLDKTGSKFLGWGAKVTTRLVYGKIVYSIVINLFKMVKAIVIKSFQLVAKVFSALTSVLV